jgi:NADPH:quinone reductase-like Zn-dependent oxidoreductase
MRRVIFEEKGGPEVLKFETLDLPSPATGEVRIKIKAIGLNRYESMFRQGVYVVLPELPSAIGAEAVGIVEALGGDVSGFSVGDRVTAVPFTTIAGTGVYADTANVPTTTQPWPGYRCSRTPTRGAPLFVAPATSTITRAKSSVRITWLGNSIRNAGKIARNSR